MAGNSGLNAASKDKQDEFYTQLSDVEKELESCISVQEAIEEGRTDYKEIIRSIIASECKIDVNDVSDENIDQ